MDDMAMKAQVVGRAVRDGVSEREAKWYLLKLVEGCKKSGLRYVDAERMAIDVFDDELAEYEFGNKNRFAAFRAKKERIPKKVIDLIDALEKAKESALKHKDDEDGGTCNFDTPTLRLEGWTEPLVKRACRVVDLDCQKWEKHYMNYHIYGACNGQANRHTNMAEAFTDSMRSSGYEADVWYAMD